MEKSSSLVGFFISLGKQFVNSKTKDLDEDILPQFQSCLGDTAVSHVCIGYGVLMWFVLKVQYKNYYGFIEVLITDFGTRTTLVLC